MERWLEQHAGEKPFRVLVLRAGQEVFRCHRGVEREAQPPIASAAKSVYSSMLAIAVVEGVIASSDDAVVDYYPEMMDVPEGAGPKPGRFARPKDRAITFRQLIGNISGYLKPGEAPGTVFHYQTFGMDILCHAIATAYGRYDSREPDRLPGFGSLVAEKIRDPLGATWSWDYTNFDLPAGARTNIFGNYTQLRMTADDLARLGEMWRHFGRIGDRQIVPEPWLREAVRVNPVAAAAGTGYGLGFWSNARGTCWPHLPRDSFAAIGAGRHMCWVCPSLQLVVAQCPGLFEKHEDEDTGLLAEVVRTVAPDKQ